MGQNHNQLQDSMVVTLVHLAIFCIVKPVLSYVLVDEPEHMAERQEINIPVFIAIEYCSDNVFVADQLEPGDRELRLDLRVDFIQLS